MTLQRRNRMDKQLHKADFADDQNKHSGCAKQIAQLVSVNMASLTWALYK